MHGLMKCCQASSLMGLLQVVQTLAAVGVQTVEVAMNFTAPADAAYNIILGERGVIILPGCWCIQVKPPLNYCMQMVGVPTWSFALAERSAGLQRLPCSWSAHAGPCSRLP